MQIASTVALAALLVGYAGQTQRPGDARSEFDLLETFRCDFTESEGRRTTAEGVSTEAAQVVFSDLVVDSIDYQKRSARFVGNAGSSTMMVLDGATTASFIEEAPIGGNVNILSIFKRTERMGAITPSIRVIRAFIQAISLRRSRTALVADSCRSKTERGHPRYDRPLR